MDTVSIILGISNLLVAAALILLAIPLARRKVRMNRVYGMRTKSAFESERNWYEINAYGGRQLIRWSIPLAVLGIAAFFLPLDGRLLPILLIACAPLIVLIPAFLTWRYGKRLSLQHREDS